MPVLKYLSGGSYVPLPGGLEEVTISPNQPPVPTDLWLDTDDDTSYPDNILSGFRNVIRNGDMSVRQRGAGPWAATGTNFMYTVDGWRSTHGAGTSANIQANAIAPGSIPVTDAQCVLTASQATGDTTNNYFHLSQVIEDVRTLAGKVVTLSFVGYTAAGGNAKIGVNLDQNFGSGGSPSATVVTHVGTVNLTSAYTRYSLTFTVPSITGKTIGTNETSTLTILIWLSGGTTYAASNGGITVQTNTFCFTDFQLEAGSVATPFERLPLQQQLAWCQRYYYRYQPNSATSRRLMHGMPATSTQGLFMSPLPVLMRSTPTITSSGVAGFGVYNGSVNLAITAFSAHEPAADMFSISATVTGGTVTGVLQLYAASGAHWLAASAEY